MGTAKNGRGVGTETRDPIESIYDITHLFTTSHPI